MRAWLGREPQGRLPRVAFVKSPRGTGCAGRCLSLGCIDVRKTKLLSASFVSKELVAHAAARAGGGAIAGTRASFFLCAPELTQSWRIPAWTFPLPAPGWVRKGVFTHTRRPFHFRTRLCERLNTPRAALVRTSAMSASWSPSRRLVAPPTRSISRTASKPTTNGSRRAHRQRAKVAADQHLGASEYSNPRSSSRSPNLAAPRRRGAGHLRVMARLRVARSTI